MNTKSLISGTKHLPFGTARRLGARFARPVFVLADRSEEGAKLLEVFFSVADSARLSSPSKETLEVLDQVVEQLDKLAGKTLQGGELQAFKGEIEQRTKVVVYRASMANAEMPKSARFTAILSEGTRVTLASESAQYQGAFLNHLSEAIKAGPNPIQQTAITAFNRMLTVVGNEYEEGWSRVFNYCVQNAVGISKAIKALKDMEAQIAEAQTNVPALMALLTTARRRLGGYLYPIRGELAEIYLHHWPDWRIQLSSLQELAAAVARRMGKGWKPEPFSGGVWVDGKKAWDEGILLIKAPTAGDLRPRVALYMAAQVKVEILLTALEQIIKDRRREIGKGINLPRVTIIKDNLKREFDLEVLPSDIQVIRYIFNARGGKLSPADVAKLKALNLQATQMQLDISIEEFEALARLIMEAAERYLAR